MLLKYHSQESLWAENCIFEAKFIHFFFAPIEIMCIFVAKFLINSMARSFIPFLTHCSKAPFAPSEAFFRALRGGG